MSIIPPKLIQLTVTNVTPGLTWTIDDGTSDPWINKPYRWSITAAVSSQHHSSHLTSPQFVWDGNAIQVGGWIGCVNQGFTWKIVSITTQAFDSITLVMEDVDRYNTFIDPDYSNAGTPILGNMFYYELGDDGLPVTGPASTVSAIFGSNAAFQSDLANRFRSRNYQFSYIPVSQAGHGLSVNDLIYLNSSSIYQKAQAVAGKSTVIGSVTSIGTPGPDWFTFRPVSELVTFTTSLLPGNPGSFVYLDPTTPGSYTSTMPANYSVPVYIKISNYQGIRIDSSVASSSAGSTGPAMNIVANITDRNNLPATEGMLAFVTDNGNTEWEIYLYKSGTWSAILSQDASDTDAETIGPVDITYTSPAITSLATISSGRRVASMVIEVITAFDDPNVVFSIGDSVNTSRLVGDADVDLSVVTTYQVAPIYVYSAETVVNAYLDPKTSTHGELKITMSYL